jgi:hypothetical protein
MDSSQEKSVKVNQAESVPTIREQDKKPPVQSTSSFRLGLRFLLGSALLLNDEAQKRFAKAQQEIKISQTQRKVLLAKETSLDRERYTLIGLMVAGDEAVERMLANLGHLGDWSFRKTKHTIKPITNNRIVRPLNRRYDHSIQRGENILQGLIESGRLEEFRSRRLAQEATTETIEEILDYLATSPEMDQLVDAEMDEMPGETIADIQADMKRTSKRIRRWFQRNFNPESDTSSARKQNPSKPD